MNELDRLLPAAQDALRGLPPTVAALVVLTAVVLLLLLVFAVLASLGGLFRRTPSSDGPSLAERAEPILRARSPIGRLDTRFERMIEGTQTGLTASTAAGLILFVGAVAAAAVGLLTFDLLPTLLVGLLAALLTYFTFVLLQNRRRRRIQELLPDGCFQLARSLRSGLNLQAALRETSRYVPAPLSPVLERLGVALTLGESTRAAVRRVADDVQLTEFDLFTEVIATHAESGGNMPAMLDRLAASMRDRNQFRGYFRTVTALGRATAVFLALAGPFGVVMYLIFQPELFARFVNASEGRQIIAAAVVLEVIGLIWLYFLLRRRDEY